MCICVLSFSLCFMHGQFWFNCPQKMQSRGHGIADEVGNSTELFVSAKSLSLTFIISAYLDSFRGWNFLSIYDANMNQ